MPRLRSSWATAALLAGVLLAQHCAAETRICLNMITKNEKKDLPQALEAFGPELSGYIICDTGSSDGTPQIAQDYFDGINVPGVVAYHDWKDFSTNRNRCIREGMKWSRQQAKRTGMFTGFHYCDYLLFLDADQFLHLPPDAKPGDLKAMNLTKDVYLMTERGVSVTYKNVRLASTRVEWEWVGEVHEYVHRVDGKPTDLNSLIDGYWLEHDASGGNTGDRFVRDEQLLSKAVEEKPFDPRSRFYLANTYRALKRFEDAIKHYIVRIKLNGWEEEKFMSALNIANLAKTAYEQGELVSPQIKAHLANWDSGMRATDEAAEAEEEERLQAAKASLAATLESLKAPNATDAPGARKRRDIDEVAAALDSEEVRELNRIIADITDKRKEREFDWVVAAYWAAAQIMPYRPEPWVHLAKLYRLEKNDNEKCYSYAAAALAQGEAKADALFLNTQMSRYFVLDEVCSCGYWVGPRVLQQAQMACRQLEQRMVEDLAEKPDEFVEGMLKRVRGNIGWYEWKECSLSGSSSCKKPQ